jgi:anionic cell wall polymer biosynthesis LytR-Cps2A-Psr (LCP) family protein
VNDLEDRLRLLMDDVTRQAPTAPQRSAQLRRRIAVRRRMWAAGIAGLAALLVVAVVGASAGPVWMRANRGVAPATLLNGGAVAVHPSLTGPKNILLVRLGQDFATPGAPDSIMIMHIPAGYDRRYLTSIPLGTYAAIPAYDNGSQRYGGGKDRIEAAYTLGARGLSGADARRHGFELLTRTLTALTGLTFDAAAVIDLNGVEQVVSALGGVDMYVDEKTTSIDVGSDDANGQPAAPYVLNPDGTVGRKVPGVTPVVYDVGTHHFAAWQAVDYTRQRDLLAQGDFEYGRERHQQQLVKAIYQTLDSSGTLTNPVKLNSFLNTLGQAATIDTGGVALGDWLYALRGLNPNELVCIAMNGGQFDSAKIGGEHVELLSDTSMQLLRALHDDTIADFIVAHPSWVSRS